ncbi:MAG TPA: gamma carbonic anhydrase family protein [Dehalococcoidia bacterium]|nr:gamma carbonic anhydrase family protein [Dehalococcoidia bacterium]
MLYRFRNREPKIGKDTYVSEHALLIGDVRIGDNCYVGHGAILRGDYGSIEIDSGTAVEEGVVVHAPPDQVCRIGKKVTIGHGAVVHSKSIGDLAVVGMGAVLSLFSEIGEESIVAEGSTVKLGQVIPPRVVVSGSPARVSKDITEDNRTFWKYGKQLYIDLAKEYIRDGMQRMDS